MTRENPVSLSSIMLIKEVKKQRKQQQQQNPNPNTHKTPKTNTTQQNNVLKIWYALQLVYFDLNV